MNLTLITGGARSGKSKLAEQLAAAAGCPVTYVATLERPSQDEELLERIERHRQRRPPQWRNLEIPVNLAEAVMNFPAGPQLVLIDCLSVYVSNILLEATQSGRQAYSCRTVIMEAVENLLSAISCREDLSFLLVTNEVGSSLVPENSLGRAYRDFLGEANQLAGQQAVQVWLTICGQKLSLKPAAAG